MPNGVVGNCGARHTKDGELWTRAWGVGTTPVADPVEKKPLNHFLPGTKVLSFGLPGCNLKCTFCQNWNLSTSNSYEICQSLAPEQCVQMALVQGCSAIAFTYNEPIISSEFCLEVSSYAHQAGLKTVAVSNGYIHGGARGEFFDAMDAVNVDLKSINPDFYAKFCKAKLEPVLETLEYLACAKRTWMEVTNLIIPGLNDSEQDIGGLVNWFAKNLGSDVPLHFSAFHPAYRMQTLSRTPLDTLQRAKERALASGLHYVYLGNVPQAQTTLCPNCQTEIIQRLNYLVTRYEITAGKCQGCGTRIAGVFE
jgi:pyruvate formate lyase activating enzyme